MDESDLAYTPATRLAEEIRTGELSPVELVQCVLDRIAAAQPMLNCFITVCADQAMAAARAAEAALRPGAALWPLHGIPFTVKDLIDTAGVRTTQGSIAYRNRVPTADAVSIARLKEAGAILVGKTTTPEFGHGPLTGAPLFGRTHNPWDPTRTSGGSSGGAGAAAAAGLAPLNLASDGGGSTRIPAAACGVVGLKQTRGLVPDLQHPDGFASTVTIGPITRTVADAALMLEVMAGPHPLDPLSDLLATADYRVAARAEGDLGGLRIAWRPRMGNTVVDGEVLAACEAGVRAFAALGADVEEVADDFFNTEPFWLIISNCFWHARCAHLLDEYRDRMTPALVRAVESAETYSAVQYQQAACTRTKIFRKVQGWFEDHDLILSPTLTRTAIPIDHDFSDPIEIAGAPVGGVRQAWYPYTHPFNLTGHPALTLPCGWATDGLPIGLQIVGRRLADETVLRAAALFEAAHPWAHKRPNLPAVESD